jgi:hypothetical protein
MDEGNLMALRIHFILASTVLALSKLAQANCSPTLTEHISSVQRIVDSARPDKPGQMRVVASGGLVFTNAEAHWMNARLRLVQRTCAQGDETAADKALRDVNSLLIAHKHAS